MTTHLLRRDGFRLELSLDDDTRRFSVVCNPPAAFDDAEVQKQTKKWYAHVARGFAQRHGICYSGRLKFIEGRQVDELNGLILPV
jgi:hypothetical protein